jgi:hypothetical protein
MIRRWVFMGWLALAASVPSSWALAQQEAVKPIQIVLRPARAPVPALKYLLLPERRALVQGNAAIFYHRAVEIMLDKYGSAREQKTKKQKDIFADEAAVETWVSGPLSSIPRERANRLLDDRRNALREVDLGARRQSCDWEFDQREEGVWLLIQEISEMRALIRLVSLQARVAVLEGHIVDPGACRCIPESDNVQAAGRPDSGSRHAQPVLGDFTSASPAYRLLPRIRE